MNKFSDWGIIGLGTIGINISINFSRNGIKLSIYNRHVDGLEENVAQNIVKRNKGLKDVLTFDNIESFVKSIKKPRKILVLIPYGKPVDEVIELLLNHLSKGDIIVDGGNSYFRDTERREVYLKRKKINFLGIGISGGTIGAKNGPSIMVGGSKKTYKKVESELKKISAISPLKKYCCERVGPSSSGHYVKMIHNGIEYVEMQLIAECYDIMKTEMQYDNLQISKIFGDWSKTNSRSYLLKISQEILKFKKDDSFLIDKILDKSENKGTGIWAAISGIELGVPNTLMNLAVNSRYISFQKEVRSKYSKLIKKKQSYIDISINDLKLVYDFSRIINFYQGFEVLKSASKNYKWKLNLSDISFVWSNGSILSSELIILFKEIFENGNDVLNDYKINKYFISKYNVIKKIIVKIQASSVPSLLISNSIIFFDLITQKEGTGNLIQAQRDYFGSHGFNLIDSKKLIKNNWNDKEL